jgi:hypothetical protein
MTSVDREELLSRWRRARLQYNASVAGHMGVLGIAGALGVPGEIGIDASSDAFRETTELQSARRSYAELTALEADYFQRLPRIAMGPCAVCGKVLHRSFDPLGVDGLWWRSDAHPDEPPACPHFCVLMGAVDLRASRPQPDFDVHPGPGVPFVVPRLLEHPGMVAVVSEIEMADGALAYPIAYFAPRRPPVQLLTASWARTNFVYTTQLGVHAWRLANALPRGQSGEEACDFEVQPWLEQGRVRWCEPRTDRSTLSSNTPDAFPFVNPSGVRRPQVIFGVLR